MTSGILEPDHGIDASLESVRRALEIARRALRARQATIHVAQDRNISTGNDLGSTISATIATGDAVAELVVHDAPGRQWSEDDRAILSELAALVAEAIRLRGERDHPRPVFDRPGTPLDAADPEPDAGPVQAADADDAGGTMRILLADDLDLNRKLISDMLSLDGYVVDTVPDGAAAVEAAKAKPYDLILMDMIMPGMDGMDATRAIRALPSPACDVPIVALTAHSFREQLDNCLDAGMNATLTKPMSFEALSDAVSTWVRPRPQAA